VDHDVDVTGRDDNDDDDDDDVGTNASSTMSNEGNNRNCNNGEDTCASTATMPAHQRWQRHWQRVLSHSRGQGNKIQHFII
jgi:hypothetical protein